VFNLSLEAIAIVRLLVGRALQVDSMRLCVNGTRLDSRQTTHRGLPGNETRKPIGWQLQILIDVGQSIETLKPRPQNKVQQRRLRTCKPSSTTAAMTDQFNKETQIFCSKIP